MPLYLPPPEHDPRGPDGEGWNRISLGAHYGTPRPQCALRPRTYPALFDTMRDTRHSRFGYHNPCINPPRYDVIHRRPDCANCPILTAAPRTLHAPGDRVLVRLESRLVGSGFATEAHEIPHVMRDPDHGWDSAAELWQWDELVRLRGWRIGRAVQDEHSSGFWLERRTAPSDPTP